MGECNDAEAPQRDRNANICLLGDPDLYVPDIEPPDYFYFKHDPDVDLETRIWRERIVELYKKTAHRPEPS